MKLIIQIPCFNEEHTLLQTLKDLPTEIPGIDEIELLVIDDGSTDKTVQVARDFGVKHISSLGSNKGLSTAFIHGVETALSAGADIIVNTDADNQYFGNDVSKLVAPILKGEADFVIGTRDLSSLDTYNPIKRCIHRWGSVVVRLICQKDITDPVSGFRAITRDTALKMKVYSKHTYTIETLIHASRLNLRIKSVDVRVNPLTRPSRLVKSMIHYMSNQLFTTIRIFAIYRPLFFFLSLSMICLLPGILIGLRFLYLYLNSDGDGHVQSLILSSILILSSVVFFALGIIADLISVNRQLHEESDFLLRKNRLKDN